jgi:Domain of unknown function (DUF4177)
MPMKWEYHVMQLKTDVGFWSGTEFDAEALQDELNRLGAEGWEVVSIFDIEKTIGGSKYVNVVLKRNRDE